MNIEEAIAYVKETREYLAGCSKTEQEKCDMEISALRAQQEQERQLKCFDIPGIRIDKKPPIEYRPAKLDSSRWEGCGECRSTVISQKMVGLGRRYCLYCGRPLTEEAWAELERRINGGKTDDACEW